MDSLGFLAGRQIFEECHQSGNFQSLKMRNLQHRPKDLFYLLRAFEMVGGWPRSVDPVADFWRGFASGQASAPPRRPQKTQLPLF